MKSKNKTTANNTNNTFAKNDIRTNTSNDMRTNASNNIKENISNNLKTSTNNKKSFEELEQFDKVKTRVLKYVFYKKRTAEEVRRKFDTIFDKDLLNEVIDNLVELGYINDNSYIDRAVNEYMSLKDMSIREVRYKLLAKGLKSKTIDEYFETNYDILKEYEIKSAKNIAIKKSKTMDKIEIKGFLMRKGYAQESIKEAIQ